MKLFVWLLTRFRLIIILPILIGISIPSIQILTKLKFEYNIENFFSVQDPRVLDYQQFKKSFGNENEAVLIGIRSEKGINLEFIRQIDTLVEKIESLEDVLKVHSITNFAYKIKIPMLGWISQTLINQSDEKLMTQSLTNLYTKQNPFQNFISEDKYSLQLIVQHESNLTESRAKILLDLIKSLTKNRNFSEVHFAGRIVTQEFFTTEMKTEMKWFGLSSFIIFTFSLFFFLRSSKLVLSAIFSLILSILFTFALIVLLGYTIELMMTLIPAIMLITATSLFVHLSSKYKHHLSITKDASTALSLALNEGLLPVILSVATTIVGFMSLAFVPVLQLQLFGFFTAIGILITAIVSLLIIVPTLKKITFANSKLESLENNSEKYLKHKYLKLGSLILVSILGIISVQFVRVENKFLDDLPEDSELKKSLHFFDTNFAGIRPLEVQIEPGHNLFESFKEMEVLHREIERIYETKLTYSPVTIYKYVNQCSHSGNTNYYEIPDDSTEFSELHKIVEKGKLLNSAITIYNKEVNCYRISFRTKDKGSIYHLEKLKQLESLQNSKLNTIKMKVTGVSNLIDDMNRGLTTELLQGLIFSIILITAFIYLIIRSLRIMLLSLIPNLVPLIIILVIMWIFNIPLKIGTVTVFTIVLGLSVDDTIHFLVGYKNNKKKLNNQTDAIIATVREYRKPMLQSSLILIAGFGIFSFSQFLSISYLGLIVSFSLLIAFWCDVHLLPVLLDWQKNPKS